MRTPGSSHPMVGVIGASGFVGRVTSALLRDAGHKVVAFSRSPAVVADEMQGDWRCLSGSAVNASIPYWLSFAPIWKLPEHFLLLEASGVRRIVAISSTSRFTKQTGYAATSPTENALALRLADGEDQLQAWAMERGIEWVILRPTLIYGLGRDKNLSEIARFIRRFGFFPLLGDANGLRQPIHVEDVAGACIAAMNSVAAAGRAYNISGGEILTYKEMVTRVFEAAHRQPRFVTIPLMVFRLGVGAMRVFPRYKNWSPTMAERMNRDMVFDSADAMRDFRFKARPFSLVRKN